jgi:hypothetical protein
MISIKKSTEKGLEEVEHATQGCWINMVDPSAEEIQQVAKELDIERPAQFPARAGGDLAGREGRQWLAHPGAHPTSPALQRQSAVCDTAIGHICDR